MKQMAVPVIDFGKQWFQPIAYADLEQKLRRAGFIDPDNTHDRFCYVISFAVIMHKDRILLIEKKDGCKVLGFGKPVTWSADHAGHTRRALIMRSLYEELDVHIPKYSYQVRSLALVHDEECERASLGCVFFLELTEAIQDIQIKDKKLSLKSIHELQAEPLKGWSVLIRNFLLKRGTPFLQEAVSSNGSQGAAVKGGEECQQLHV